MTEWVTEEARKANKGEDEGEEGKSARSARMHETGREEKVGVPEGRPAIMIADNDDDHDGRVGR